LEAIEADATVVAIPEGVEAASACDPRFASIALPLFASGDLPLKPLETLMIPGPPKIIFIGIARNPDAEAWRRAAASVARRVTKVKRLGFASGALGAVAEGALVGGLAVLAYQTTGRAPPGD